MAKSGGSMALFILALLAVDAAVVVGFDARDAPGTPARSSPAAGDPDVALDWALCQTSFEGRAVTPTSVAITYLDATDRDLTPDDVRGWFGDLDGAAVQVSRLEYRSGRRRIALELWRDRWDAWDRMAGSSTGREVCGRMRAALLARDIGRPRAGDDSDRSRHDFEFIYERRSKLYSSVSWVGTLDDLLEPNAFAEAKDWLDVRLDSP